MKAKTLLEILIAFIFVYYELLFINNRYILYTIFLVFGYIFPFILISGTVTLKSVNEKIRLYKGTVKKQIVYGILISVMLFTTYSILLFIFYWAMPVDVTLLLARWMGMTTKQIVGIIIMLLEVAFFEELFFRNYLDDRISKLIHNDFVRIIVIAFIFSAGHILNVLSSFGKYNIAVVIVHVVNACGLPFFMSLVFGLFRLKVKNFTLLSCMVGHFVIDCMGNFVIGARVLPL